MKLTVNCVLLHSVFIIAFKINEGHLDFPPLNEEYIEVPLDHFTLPSSPKLFQLRYLVVDKYYSKNGIVFIYTGNKGNVTINALNSGFLFEAASKFNALLIFLEHRYYGASVPFEDDLDFTDEETLRYLSTEQTLLDIVTVIKFIGDDIARKNDVKPKFIAFGSDYGGMLAAWLRMKYPFTIIGAITSSVPPYFFTNNFDYNAVYRKATKVFELNGGKNCPKTIKLVWKALETLMKSPKGSQFISTTLKMCDELQYPDDYHLLFDWLQEIYIDLATKNYYYSSNYYTALPDQPVQIFCSKLLCQEYGEDDYYALIRNFGKALEIYTNSTRDKICNRFENIDSIKWKYQLCREFIIPMCSTDDDMFLTDSWSKLKQDAYCMKNFGIKTTEDVYYSKSYGEITLEYTSNIIFSNPLMNPWSVSENYKNANNNILHFNISNAPYLIDFRESHILDNVHVTRARLLYVNVIREWLDKN